MHRLSAHHRASAQPLRCSNLAASGSALGGLSHVCTRALSTAALHTLTRRQAVLVHDRALLGRLHAAHARYFSVTTARRKESEREATPASAAATPTEGAPATAAATTAIPDAAASSPSPPLPVPQRSAASTVPPHLPPPRLMPRAPYASPSYPHPTSSSPIPFLRPASQQLFDIEAFALTEADPEKKVSLEAYKAQFNYVLQKALPVAELLRVFRSWVSHMPSPPDLPYIHSYIDARVRKGHSIRAVLEDLKPFLNQFTDQTLVSVMLLCAKQRSTDETIGALRFIHTHVSHRIPLTLALMNRFINNFSLQNDISGATILYDELTSYSLIPDLETYESMYLGFARMKEMEAAFSVFGHMQQRGMPLQVAMFEAVIEVCIRYDNAEAGLLTLQRVSTFNETQPTAADGTRTVLNLTPRCFELLIRAYLNKQQLDLVMQIYFELRKGEMVLSSLADFNSLLELISKNITFQDALQVMADRIQAHEKYITQKQQLEAAVAQGANAGPRGAADDAAATTALASLTPISPPHISSFNILLRIAGLVDRNLGNIQLIISELQRIQCRMNTETFNLLIESYASLKEIKGMTYIYDEFKKAAITQAEEQLQAQTQTAIAQASAASAGAPSTSTSLAVTTPAATGPIDPTALHPDVQTFNIMLAQIDPRTFLADLHGVEAQSSTLVTEPPVAADEPPAMPLSASMAQMSAGLTSSEAASMQMVESLLTDMRTFRLMPDEATFKLILRIMSGVGNAGAAAADTALLAAPSASAVVSPHVVHFFNMLMDLVVAHQSVAAPSTAATASVGHVPTKPATTVAFESSWYSFLDFLYRSSDSTNQATNFHYILLCLRRLKRDGCGIPKSVIKSLLLNHLGGARKHASVLPPSADTIPPVAATQITEVHWLQAIHFLREFSSAEMNIEEDVLGALLKTAHAADTEQRQIAADAGTQARPPLAPIVLQHLQRMLVWNEQADLSRLSSEDLTLLAQFGADGSVAPAAANSADIAVSSLAVRDRTHYHIFLACVVVRQYDFAMDVITDMQRHQRHVSQQHQKALAAGTIAAGTTAPTLYVHGNLSVLFKSLLDAMRRYALTTVKPLDWRPLRQLLQKCRDWNFSPTIDHYRALMDEAMRFRSASLARFVFDTAVANAHKLTETQLAAGSYWPDLRLSADALVMAFSQPELALSTRESRAASPQVADAYSDQMNFLSRVLARMVASNLPVVSIEVLLKLVQVAEQLESTEMAVTIFKYLVSVRKAPDARLYAPLIHVCRFQNAYPLALELYRAVQLADKVPFECHLALLRLHAHAPVAAEGQLVKDNMVWTIFGNLVRSAPRPIALSNAPEQLVRALSLGVSSHPAEQQLADDLPKIESIIRVLLGSTETPPGEVTAETAQRDRDTRAHMEPLLAVLSPLPVNEANNLMIAIDSTRKALQQRQTGDVRVQTSVQPKQVTPAVAHTPTRLAQLLPSIDDAPPSVRTTTAMTIAATTTAPIVADVSVEPVESVTAPPVEVSSTSVASPPLKETPAVVPKFTRLSLVFTNVSRLPTQGDIHLLCAGGEGIYKCGMPRTATRLLSQGTTLSVLTVYLLFRQATPTMAIHRHLTQAIAAATPEAPLFTGATLDRCELVEGFPREAIGWRYLETCPVTLEEQLEAIATAATPVAPLSVQTEPAEVAKEEPAIGTTTDGTAPTAEPVTPGPSMRVLGDSFLAWNELATRCANLSTTKLAEALSQPNTSRLVRNMIEHQGFVSGLKLLAIQTKLDQEAKQHAIKTGTPLPEAAIPHDRSKMLRLLFQYCLFNRNMPLFHQLCTQLQAASILPRALAFKQLSDEVLAKWRQLNAASEGREDQPTSTPSRSDVEMQAADVDASLLEGDEWTNVPTPLAQTSNAEEELVFFLRATVQWLCVAHKLPVEVWLSGVRVQTMKEDKQQLDEIAGKQTRANADALVLSSSAIKIGFNAVSLQRRLDYWVANGIPLSVERVLNVYAFKTVCVLAIRGKYQPLAQFMSQISRLPLGIHPPAVYKSSIKWLVHHDYHQQANELWTNMMVTYIPKLKYHVQQAQAETRADEQKTKPVVAEASLQRLASENVEFDTVRSLCHDLLTTYVLKTDDDTMLFRIYATMRSLNLAPPADLLGIIPVELVDTLSPAHQLLYIMVHRVNTTQGHTKIDFMMKLFGELVKVPTLAPQRFRIQRAQAQLLSSAEPASSAPMTEWPIVPTFLDAISGRIVSEYIQPSMPQKLAKPEFADQIKKLILHLDSDDAINFSSTGKDSLTQVKRDRLWNLFIALQSKGVVFNVPLLHHLAQSLATKDAVMLNHTVVGEEGANEPAPTVPIPTLVQQLWKLTVHHGEFDPNTLFYLIMAQFRHYQAAQQQRGLTLRTIRSLEYYRHILYGTPYDHPPVPRSSSLTTFADVASSGFSSEVALQWLGLGKLDLPLVNIVHMFFEQIDRDWRHVIAEDQLRPRDPDEADVEDDAFDHSTDLPLNAHSYNYILQSYLLFTKDSIPVRWPQIRSVLSQMADRHYMLNATSTLYLLDTLIEAGELQEARARLPPASPKEAAASLLDMEPIQSAATEAAATPSTQTDSSADADAPPKGEFERALEATLAASTVPEASRASASHVEPSLENGSDGPTAATAAPTSLWSRIHQWFAGSDEQAATDNMPAVPSPAVIAAAAQSQPPPAPTAASATAVPKPIAAAAPAVHKRFSGKVSPRPPRVASTPIISQPVVRVSAASSSAPSVPPPPPSIKPNPRRTKVLHVRLPCVMTYEEMIAALPTGFDIKAGFVAAKRAAALHQFGFIELGTIEDAQRLMTLSHFTGIPVNGKHMWITWSIYDKLEMGESKKRQPAVPPK